MSGQRGGASGTTREPWPWQQRQAEEARKAAAKSRRVTTSRGGAGGGAGTKKPKGKWSRGWRRWLKWMVIAFASFVALGLLLFAYAYAHTSIPSPNQAFQTQTSYVYYSDGKTVLGKFQDQNRTMVKLSDVPTTVQDAVVAAEDRTFWTNNGIDPKGILRAAFNDASGGSTQGGSTITQQYVKVYYLSQERTWTRKIKEAILSLKIQRQMSKDQILQGYLNTIYFGRGAYGIEAAAEAYFRVHASQLTLQQGAVLASLINSPSTYDPANGKASLRALRARYHYVINGMASMGTLPAKLVGTRKVYRLPKFPPVQTQSQYGGQRGHVLQMVRASLVKLGFSDAEIDGGGLRITTTFSKKDMTAAAQGVAEQRPKLKDLHVAVASVDPRTGALRGMYAGQDYLKSQINWAVAGGAPGSAFKPFSLATGLDYGYSLKSTFEGNSPLQIGTSSFKNEGAGTGMSYGSRISLLYATEQSVNTAYIDMVHSIPNGPQRVIDTATRMGIPADAPGLIPNLSIVLGSATISPIDMANAYGTIADAGKAKKVYCIQGVKSADGHVQYKHSGGTSQAITPQVAADTSYALQQVAKVGTGTNSNTIGRPVAGKTGTATDDQGHVRSSWYVGYTPQLSTAVMYVRGNGNAPLDGYLDSYFGGTHPALTWAAVMRRALAGDPVLPFPPPANLQQTVAGHQPLPTAPPSPTKTTQPSKTAQPTHSPTPTPTPTPTPSPTPSPSQPPSPSPSPTIVPSPSGSSPPGGGSSGGPGGGGGSGGGGGGGSPGPGGGPGGH